MTTLTSKLFTSGISLPKLQTEQYHLPTGRSNNTQGIEADLVAEAIPLKIIKEASSKGNRMLVISRKAKRITLLRFLLSKFRFQSEKVMLRDLLALFQSLLDCQVIAQKDPNFQQKFGFTLEVVTKLLKGVRINKLNSAGLKSLERAIKQIPEDFLIPKRNFNQVKARVEGSYSLRLTQALGIPTNQLPPKLFIGKGYSDKGTARNAAIDGSPSWQDIAMRGNLE